MSVTESVETEALTDDGVDGGLARDDVIARLHEDVRGGAHWFEALLDAIGRWRAPSETRDGRTYAYLIAGEAFDWLLLAERLLDEAPALAPPHEVEALLFGGRWPLDLDDEDFAARLGAAKYSAHLNYVYGVLVEQALQLGVEEEIHKENRASPWGDGPRIHDAMFRRVYGAGRDELRAAYYEQTGAALRETATLGEWEAFVYWLFRQRLKRQDKARVASDTRKGLAQLSRMELAVSERRRGARPSEREFNERYAPRGGRSRRAV